MADHAYVAFLDILGYKDLLDSDIRNGEQTFKDRMIRAFRSFEGVNHSRHQYKAISDSIFITCTEREAAKEFLAVVRDVFVSFLLEGLLIRGGISFGQHFETQTITYSPVLTKSYFLEAQVAEFPRIMVDANICDMFPELARELILLKTGENWFLNIATKENYAKVSQAAQSAFEANRIIIQRSERIRIKYRWLQDFLIEIASTLDLDPPKPYLGIFDSIS